MPQKRRLYLCLLLLSEYRICAWSILVTCTYRLSMSFLALDRFAASDQRQVYRFPHQVSAGQWDPGGVYLVTTGQVKTQRKPQQQILCRKKYIPSHQSQY